MNESNLSSRVVLATGPGIGDSVRVTVPANHHDEICVKYNGQVGVVEETTPPNAECNFEMFSVRFPDGYRDGFYEDELAIVARVGSTPVV